MTQIERNCCCEWWDEKLNDNGRQQMVEKYYPKLTAYYVGFNVNIIRDMYEKETKCQ